MLMSWYYEIFHNKHKHNNGFHIRLGIKPGREIFSSQILIQQEIAN